MKNREFCSIFILALLCTAISCGNEYSSNQCRVLRKDLNETAIYNAYGAYEQYFLGDLFEGYNLTFSAVVDEEDEELVNSISLEIDTEMELISKVNLAIQGKAIDVAILQQTNGDVVFAALDKVTHKGSTTFSVRFGYAFSHSLFEIFQGSVPIDREPNVTCFELTILDPEHVMVDCEVSAGVSGYSDRYAIIKLSSTQMFDYTWQSMTPVIKDYRALTREVRTLSQGNDTLVIQAYLINSFNEDISGENIDSIAIYNYSSKALQQGELTRIMTLNGEDFDWDSLSIIDIQVLEERVFILDQFNGIASFEVLSATEIGFVRTWDLSSLFQTGKTFGFAVDYDGGRLQFTVVCQYDLKVIQLDSLDDDPEVVEEYSFDEPVLNKIGVQVSPKNIILKEGTSMEVYKRNRFDNSLLASQLYDVDFFNLFDSEHLWVWRFNEIGVYVLQEPTLEIHQTPYTDDEDPLPVRIKVTATSAYDGLSTECTLVFYSSGVPADTQKIYFSNYREDEYKTHSGQDWQKYYIDREYIGPNMRFVIDYNQSDLTPVGGYVNEEDPIFVFSVPKLIDGEIEGAAPEDFTFSALIGFSKEVHIYLFQLANHSLQFYTCFDRLEYTVYTQKCVLQDQENLNSSIKLISDGILGGEEVIAIVESEQPSMIRFYDISGEQMDAVPFSKDGSNVNISSFVLQHNMLILVDNGDHKCIEVHEKNSQGFNLLYTIDSKYVADWYQLKAPGSKENITWVPLAVATHYHHPNTLVALDQSGLAVFISLEDRPKYLSHLNLTAYCSGAQASKCHISLTTDTFLLLHGDGLIKRYGIQDLTKPDFLFDFQFYNYKVFTQDTKDLHYAVSNYSGFVYVLAADLNNENTSNLLIFRSNQEQVRTLYQAIEMFGEILTNQSKVCLSADGAKGVDFAFVSVNNNYYSFRVPLRESIDILPNDLFPETAYTKNFKFRYDAISMDQSIYDPVVLDILFVNDQNDVYVNRATLEGIGFYEGLKPLTGDFPQKLELYSIQRYFHGPVLGLNISCDACSDFADSNHPIRFVNRVQRSEVQNITKTLNKVVSSYQHPETKTVYILQDVSVQAYTPVKYDLKQEFSSVSVKNPSCTKSVTCHQLVPMLSQDQKSIVYLLGICECDQMFYVSVIGFEDEQNLKLKNERFINLAGVQGNDFGMAQYFNERLFILFNSFYAYKNSVQVFDILKDILNGKTISNSIQKIDNSYLNMLYDSEDYLELTSFQVTTTDVANNIMIFLTNATKNFFAIEVDDKTLEIIDPDSFRIDPGVYTFRFFDQLIDEYQFVSETSKIVGIHIYDQYIINNYVNYDVLVLTTEIPIYLYGIQLVVPGSRLLPLLYEPEDCGPILAFGHYGEATIQHLVKQVDDYFVVAYYDTYQDSYTLAVYQEDQGLQNERDGYVAVPFVQMIGGYNFAEVNIEAGDDTLFGFLLYKNDLNETKLFAPDPNRNKWSVLVDINNKTYFEFQNNDFQSQEITITALSSQLEEYYVVSEQGIIGPYPKNGSKSSSSDGWIIAVSVIGGVIFLGIIGFFGWKYYKSRKTEETQEDGYSLQEPVRA